MAPQASTYTKNEVDARLAVKADQAALDGKADQTELVALSGDVAGKQDTLTFAAPLSLSGSTLGVDYSGSALSVATIQTTGGLTLDAPGVIVRGDLAVDSVLLASDIQPRLSDQVALNANVAISGGLTVPSIHGAAVDQIQGAIEQAVASKQDALSFAAPLSLTGSALGPGR